MIQVVNRKDKDIETMIIDLIAQVNALEARLKQIESLLQKSAWIPKSE